MDTTAAESSTRPVDRSLRAAATSRRDLRPGRLNFRLSAPQRTESADDDLVDHDSGARALAVLGTEHLDHDGVHAICQPGHGNAIADAEVLGVKVSCLLQLAVDVEA